MGVPDVLLVTPDAVGEELRCGVCMCLCKDPYVAPCKSAHLFCRECIQESPWCPVDMEEIDPTQLEPAPAVLQKIIERIEVKCEFCDWKGTLGELESHQNLCDRTPIVCPFSSFGCDNKMPRKLMRDHENAYREVHLELLLNEYNKSVKQRLALEDEVQLQKMELERLRDENAHLVGELAGKKMTHNFGLETLTARTYLAYTQNEQRDHHHSPKPDFGSRDRSLSPFESVRGASPGPSREATPGKSLSISKQLMNDFIKSQGSNAKLMEEVKTCLDQGRSPQRLNRRVDSDSESESEATSTFSTSVSDVATEIKRVKSVEEAIDAVKTVSNLNLSIADTLKLLGNLKGG